MTETNANAIYKVGDKVRVLDASKISRSDDLVLINGLATVYGVAEIGNPWLTCKDGSAVFVQNQQLRYIEKVADKPTKNQRISALEAQVAELVAKVKALEALPKPTEVAEMFAKAQLDAKVKAAAPRKKMALTPNELRKAIIAEAQAFVAGVTERMGNGVSEFGEGNFTFRCKTTSAKFHVNPEKRAVTALVYGVNSGKLLEKDIAKCAPGDVFNADIGKAIALGRALGLDVSKFEQAVQPTEVVVGQVVENTEYSNWGSGKVTRIESPCKYRGYFTEDTSYNYLESAVITDDTEAQYE